MFPGLVYTEEEESEGLYAAGGGNLSAVLAFCRHIAFIPSRMILFPVK